MKEQKKQGGITVFFSYAQADQAVRDQLATHLSQLKRDGLIEEWSDQQILAGSDRAQAIDQAIRSAQIILLLISAEFLASDACYQIEMKQALERHRAGVARVIPIIVRPCDWEHSPFAHLQYLPRNRKPIVTLRNRDKAFLAIAQELRRVIAQQLLPSPPLSRVPRQNRERMLKRVRDFWITGLLDQSLHQAVLLDLHLQDQPDALENPFRLQVQEIGRLPYPLPVGTSIIQVYDEAGGELLILGEPGAGKTTLLLQLTQTLLDRALVDERSPIPVIFNLSSWAQKQEPLARWLAEELKTKYRVNDQIGQHWIAMNQILPLLDGLDEVAELARIACVRAITAYYLNHPSQVVICCRSEEYQALSLHLPLQRAISVLPLTADQIDRYLSSAQGQLEGLRQALHDDTELSELARRPLMLSIFTLAYQGRAVDDFQVRGSLEEQRQQVFATYVQRMLERRGVSTRYTQKQAKWWLSWLAQQMVRHKQVEFSIEQLQIDWFSGSQRSKLFMLVLCWLVTWITLGSIGGLIIALISRQLTGFLTVLAIELIVVSFYGYYDYSELEGKIEVTEALSWYPEGFWRSAWNSIVSTFKEEPGVYLAGGIFGAVVGLVCGVATGLLYGLPKGLINGVITGLVSGALLMLLAHYSCTSSKTARLIRRSDQETRASFAGAETPVVCYEARKIRKVQL